MREDSIFIVDDDGKEIEMKIYFTFDLNDKQYAVLHEVDHEEELYPFTYDDEGNIYPVEDPEELEIVQEVLDAYEEEK